MESKEFGLLFIYSHTQTLTHTHNLTKDTDPNNPARWEHPRGDKRCCAVRVKKIWHPGWPGHMSWFCTIPRGWTQRGIGRIFEKDINLTIHPTMLCTNLQLWHASSCVANPPVSMTKHRRASSPRGHIRYTGKSINKCTNGQHIMT